MMNYVDNVICVAIKRKTYQRASSNHEIGRPRCSLRNLPFSRLSSPLLKFWRTKDLARWTRQDNSPAGADNTHKNTYTPHSQRPIDWSKNAYPSRIVCSSNWLRTGERYMAVIHEVRWNEREKFFVSRVNPTGSTIFESDSSVVEDDGNSFIKRNKRSTVLSHFLPGNGAIPSETSDS